MAMALDVGSPYHGSPHHPDAIHYISTSPASDPLQLLASNPAIYPPGYAGNLSLHNYRKLLSDSDPFIDGQDGKLLRRKNAALHLNQTQLDSVPLSTPFSMSSPGSSPPPLSPSYSPSARSDQDPDMPHGFGLSLNVAMPAPLSAPLSATFPRENPHRLLDTFRDRLESYPEPGTDPECFTRRHTRTRSDSILWSMKKTTATIVDHGTSFEIINPHESLNFARIVSFIEDVDAYSLRASSGHHRESYIEVINETEVDPSPESQPGDDHADPCSEQDSQQVHHELVGDSPHLPMPSISERLEREDADDMASNYSRSPACTRKRPAPLRPRAWTGESDLGEPGSPIREDGDCRSHVQFPLPTPSPYSLSDSHPTSLPGPAAAYYDLNLWYGPHGVDQGQGHPHPLLSNPTSPHNLCPSPFISHLALPQQQEIRIQSGITKITDRRKKNVKPGSSGPLKPLKRLYNMLQRKRQ